MLRIEQTCRGIRAHSPTRRSAGAQRFPVFLARFFCRIFLWIFFRGSSSCRGYDLFVCQRGARLHSRVGCSTVVKRHILGESFRRFSPDARFCVSVSRCSSSRLTPVPVQFAERGPAFFHQFLAPPRSLVSGHRLTTGSKRQTLSRCQLYVAQSTLHVFRLKRGILRSRFAQ